MDDDFFFPEWNEEDSDIAFPSLYCPCCCLKTAASIPHATPYIHLTFTAPLVYAKSRQSWVYTRSADYNGGTEHGKALGRSLYCVFRRTPNTLFIAASQLSTTGSVENHPAAALHLIILV
jgi:hypothetical protein